MPQKYDTKTPTGHTDLWVDQWNLRLEAANRHELIEQARKIGITGRVSKMYQDATNGKRYHTGYVIGNHWFTRYRAVVIEQ